MQMQHSASPRTLKRTVSRAWEEEEERRRRIWIDPCDALVRLFCCVFVCVYWLAEGLTALSGFSLNRL